MSYVLLEGTVGEGELSRLFLSGVFDEPFFYLLLLLVFDLLGADEPLENGVVEIVAAGLDVLSHKVKQLEVELLTLPHHSQ